MRSNRSNKHNKDKTADVYLTHLYEDVLMDESFINNILYQKKNKLISPGFSAIFRISCNFRI